MERIRVLIADDHELLREVIRDIIEKEGDMVVAGQASTAAEALAIITRASPVEAGASPGIVLAGAGLDGLDGLIRAARERAPRVACIVHSLGDGEAAIKVIRAGARGCVSKVSGAAELLGAIRTVAGGNCFLSPGLLATVLEEFHRVPSSVEQGEPGAPLSRAHGIPSASRSEVAAAAFNETCNDAWGDAREGQIDALTPREIEVLDCLPMGGTNRDIAKALCISEKTVKNHVTSILRKLHVRSRTQAAVFAMRVRSGRDG